MNMKSKQNTKITQHYDMIENLLKSYGKTLSWKFTQKEVMKEYSK